ncbi:glycosyltransferase family 2 protein [Flavobacterium paronense]|uniref:Glycosyltransferase family 2 protein n=1 Tax=Flavobacterium paronense TaxID=1392775 RepID=A0ABV5GBL8_9FLAO|nr:glycosyltransferase family 2 protein [Flavobacterium paronense]MDN3676706.1 glycosyltransferase family 2 protein [Flavobacterium paronense]
MKPIVSIIMATYNRAHFIVETLTSIQNQTFQDWECIIIDDGGTDNTEEVINDFLDKDKRFRFLKRTADYQKGLPGCRNYGLDLATGKYVIFYDDDDIVHPQNLELCTKELDKNPISFCRYERAAFSGDFDYAFDLSTQYESFYIDKNDIEALLKNELPFNSCAVMWKKDCFNENKFVEHLMYAEEWELYSRILSTGVIGISIEKILFFGRKHTNSNTGEFYSDNPVRRKSYADAILLVVKNLKEKKLLNYSLKRYFISISFKLKEFNLYKRLIDTFEFTTFEKLKWQWFYFVLPLRLKFTKIKNAAIK